MSRIASCKNLGDGNKQAEDDKSSIDLTEYTRVEKIWRQWDDDADSFLLERRQTGENIYSSHSDLNKRIVAPS